MAKRTVDGEVELDYAPSGLTWRLTCPAANAVEPRGNGSKFQGKEKIELTAPTGKVKLPTTA
jgi:hypothetical protein